MSESPQNIVLLSADALRADHLSCYGYHRDTSPILDALAEESIQFTNAYSASSHTREAVPALLTGRYPDVAIDSKYNLASESIASMLTKNGFATGGFHSNPFVSRAYGFDQGFDVFDDDLRLGQHKLIALAQRVFDKLRNRHYARAEEINTRSLKWIDSLDDGEPFFLWNHYMDTHGPYDPPQEYLSAYRDHGATKQDLQSLYQRAIKQPESITDDERALLIDLYDAEIRYNDEKIGAFLEALRERDLLKQSLLIITADHGDAFGEHGYYEHPRYLHDEITHVPLLIHSPGTPGRTISTPVSTIDIVPTILDAIGQKTDDDRISLLSPLAKNRNVFSQVRGEKDESHLRRYALRSSEGVGFCERDSDADTLRFEECTSASHRADLEAYIENRVGADDNDTSVESEEVDDEIERRLEALGYK
ncbi:sulfatase [Halomarina salina]|uniref:Sulfatase n=1 Tax=Halomarina salina TaxID=1872699 RepID=A0ABD5RSB0_9EURY|nr:sulfatase [Halomarina salina]